MDYIQRTTWMTPFAVQVLVVIGTAINMGQLSCTIGFTARLLPQLRRLESSISVDDSSASWIASSLGFSLLVGNFIVPYIMGKFGRRPAGIISSCLILIGWIWVSLATSATSMILARTLQGLAIGMGGCVGPAVIGECSSPKNRAAFTSITVFIFCFILIAIHTMGSYMSWQTAATVIAVLTFGNVILLVLSPETPSWLADQGKYEECRRTFRYLRGTDEDDELEKLIEASKIRKNIGTMQSSQQGETTVCLKFASMKCRENYVPLIIGFNLYTLQQWCGLVILIGFIEDLFYWLVGPDTDFGLHIFLADFTRLLASIVSIFIIKRFRRRLLLSLTVGSNVVILLLISAYSYAKVYHMLLFDSPLIGILLIHLLMVSVSLGASSFVLALTSEIFPLEFRSIMGSLCKSTSSVNFFIVSKTFGLCVEKLGFHGTCCLYAIVTGTSLAIIMGFLTETKDKTLQEIEDKLKSSEKVIDENQPNCPMHTQTLEE